MGEGRESSKVVGSGRKEKGEYSIVIMVGSGEAEKECGHGDKWESRIRRTIDGGGGRRIRRVITGESGKDREGKQL
jgi:hypothetical protein